MWLSNSSPGSANAPVFTHQAIRSLYASNTHVESDPTPTIVSQQGGNWGARWQWQQQKLGSRNQVGGECGLGMDREHTGSAMAQ